MNKVALISGTGQDSSYLSELLLNENYTVYILHRRYSHNNFVNFETFKNHPNLHFICGDITDYSSVHNIVLKYLPDEIYNLAAMSHVGHSFEQPMYTFEVDAVGCMNFLECLRNLKKTTPDYKPKFYQASTSELFGSSVSYNSLWGRVNSTWDKLPHDFDYELFQDENTPFKPESPYAVAKLAAHHMCRLYRQSYGLFISSSILFNHGSPRRGGEFVERKVVKWVADFQKWLDSENITAENLVVDEDEVYIPGRVSRVQNFQFPKLRLGNLDSYRDWSHAKDMVRGIWLTLQQDTPDDYVMCSEKTNSIRDLLDISFSQIGIKDWSKYVVQDPKFMRPSEVPMLKGKCDKAKEKLGWVQEFSFSDLIKDMFLADYSSSR